MSNTILNIPDAAKHLRVSDKTIRNLIEAGSLRAFRVGRQWRLTTESLAEFAERQSNRAPAQAAV